MTESTLPDLAALEAAAVSSLGSAQSIEAIEAIVAESIGKKGSLTAVNRLLGQLDLDEKRRVGAQLQAARQRIEEFADSKTAALRSQQRQAALAADRLDLTETVLAEVTGPVARGHLHLVSSTTAELENTFVGLGFEVAEGPEAETDWYNFEALNFPPGHPARSAYDTFYLDIGEPETTVLRTHTSPTQIRLMEKAVAEGSLPIHAVMPGRCYRKETPDARHLAVFHQIEGLVVDRGITFGDLAGTIAAFTTAYFGPGMSSRLRPAYFPFTEPSAEFEITCTICRGEGCRTCTGTGWIELGGCGMVDPAVFAAVGIDIEEYSGFAFGFGIDRCAQMRYAIADMRALGENDVRFLRQF